MFTKNNRTKSNRVIVITLIALSCVLVAGVGAEELRDSQYGKLEISGFVDATASYSKTSADHTNFGLGQAEIDLESQLNEISSVNIAVAYNNETATFELGCAEIGLNLYSNDQSFFKSVDLVAGQFDVPFGIDYFCYPSVDRKLVSVPMVVELTHGGWSDVGFSIQVGHEYGNLTVYGVNGFESSAEVIDEVATLSAGYNVYEEIDNTPAYSIGSRIGFNLINNLEVGTSYSMGMNVSDEREMYLAGADLKYTVSGFEFKGEYIYHSLNRSLAQENNEGYYAQASYNKDRWTVTSRYGSFKPYQLDWYNQVSVGAGYVIGEGIEARFESAMFDNSADNTQYLQMVVAF